MIRKYKKEDFKSIKNIVKTSGSMNCAWLTTEEAIRRDVENSKITFVYDDGDIKGFTYMDKLDENATYKRVHFYMFIHPDFWWQGIAEKLWEEIKPYVEEVKPDKVTIAFHSHHSELRVLFKSQGYKHSFFSLRMEYDGGKFEEPDLEVRTYSNDDFTDYLRIWSEGFYDLRKEHDMRPYLCYSEQDYTDEKLRQNILEGSKGLYTFSKDGQVVGFGKNCDYLDVVVVDKKKQGKGFGKSIVKSCTNLLIDQGHFPVALYVLDTNIGARKLYENLGFKVKAVIEILEAWRI